MAIFLLGTFVSYFSTCFMQQYHSSKPPGHQSVLGKFTAMSSQVYFASICIYCIIFSTRSLFMPDQSLAMAMTFALYFATGSLNLTILACTVVKYLSVYHFHLLNNLDEDKLIQKAQRALFLLPIFNGIIEYTFLIDIQRTQAFHMFSSSKDTIINSDASVEPMKVVIVIITFVSMLILQIRLELDHLRFGEDSVLAGFLKFRSIIPCLSDDIENGIELNELESVNNVRQPPEPEVMEQQEPASNNYKIWVFRLMLLFALFLGLSVLFWATGQTDMELGRGVISIFIMFSTIIPIIFIASHKGLKGQAFKTLSPLLTLFNRK